MKLTKGELNLKIKYSVQEIRQLRACNTMLFEILKSVHGKGILLESDINNICSKVIVPEKYFVSLDPDSPRAFSWEEQKRYKSIKRKNSMKWHPAMIRCYLSIYVNLQVMAFLNL